MKTKVFKILLNCTIIIFTIIFILQRINPSKYSLLFDIIYTLLLIILFTVTLLQFKHLKISKEQFIKDLFIFILLLCSGIILLVLDI